MCVCNVLLLPLCASGAVWLAWPTLRARSPKTTFFTPKDRYGDFNASEFKHASSIIIQFFIGNSTYYLFVCLFVCLLFLQVYGVLLAVANTHNHMDKATFPHVRTLLEFDTREFLNVIALVCGDLLLYSHHCSPLSSSPLTPSPLHHCTMSSPLPPSLPSPLHHSTLPSPPPLPPSRSPTSRTGF